MNLLGPRLALLIRQTGVAFAFWVAIATGVVDAQDATSTPVTPPTFTRPLYLEWGISVVMIGLAIFVVCRKSNRT